jgi:hypothetical protein
MIMAGLAPTPAEEMTEENGNGAIVTSPRRKSQIAVNGDLITAQQQSKLFEIAKQSGVSVEQLQAIVARSGFQMLHLITQKAYPLICGEIQGR